MKIAQVGESVLSQKAYPVTEAEYSSIELSEFIAGLLKTMLDANGVGIAAPQVFDPRAIMIIASRPNHRYPDAPDMKPLVLINPTINWQSDEQVSAWEGCLSVPGLRGYIQRPDAVCVSYFDIEGNRHEVEFSGFVSRIFLHEFDHLIGKTWLDHVKSSEQVMAETVWAEKFQTA